MQESKVGGAITGAVIAAAANWARYDDDTQRRLRNVRQDAEHALEVVRDIQSRGEAIRSRLPTVNDAQVGIALANSTEPTPQAVPTGGAPARPDVSSTMETAVADMSWPPQPGQYDDRGMVRQVGELTTTFLTLTFEEVRAWVQGLAQTKQPSRDAKVQIFYAANSLISTISAMKLSWQDYKDAWARLFGANNGFPPGGGVPNPNTTHTSISTPPYITQMDNGLIWAKPLGLPDLPLGYEHQNTDAANKWRLTVGANTVNADTNILTITFGSPYTKNGKPYQPVVSSSDPRFYIATVTPGGFVVRNNVQLLANASFDVFFGVNG
jgi:hypothetical protein